MVICAFLGIKRSRKHTNKIKPTLARKPSISVNDVDLEERYPRAKSAPLYTVDEVHEPSESYNIETDRKLIFEVPDVTEETSKKNELKGSEIFASLKALEDDKIENERLKLAAEVSAIQIDARTSLEDPDSCKICNEEVFKIT